MGDGDPVGGRWDAFALRRYLHYRQPGTADPHLAPGTAVPQPPWTVEHHVGLMREGRTAREGFLYSSRHLRFVDGVGFAARVDAAPGPPAPTVFFGGEGRRAQVHVCSDFAGGADSGRADSGRADSGRAAPPELPEGPDDFPDGKLLLYLVTPALFDAGWRPDTGRLGAGCELVVAAVDGPQVIATASADRTTGGIRGRRLRWAVAAGSVYFLKYPDPAAAREAARRFHGRLLPQAEDDPIVTAGFGLVLTGRWG